LSTGPRKTELPECKGKEKADLPLNNMGINLSDLEVNISKLNCQWLNSYFR